MSFWEKGYLATAAAILVAGGVYFQSIWKASMALGGIAAPSWGTFGTYLVVVTILTTLSFIILGGSQAVRNFPDEDVGEFDERDRLINLQAMCVTSYITSIATYAALIWFLFHGDGNLLFHSIVAAMLFSELCMCLLHIYFYNRAV